MLAFVVPLKSAAAANSWTRVTSLAERTLRAACAQTSPDFRVIVACHEKPQIGFADRRLEFLEVDFPRPAAAGWFPEGRRDRDRKIVAAVRRALTYHPTHVMILDADDCVSNRLAAHVVEHPSANGWYFPKGYFWREGLDEVHIERRRFHQWCGSSYILRPSLLGLPEPPAIDWHLRHGPLARQLRKRATPLEPLPFPGAVYVVSHGDNVRDFGPILWPANPVKYWLRRWLYHRPLTPAMRAEFGLSWPGDDAPRASRAG
jgi:hypothetical protein